jgi:hypothetical protein
VKDHRLFPPKAAKREIMGQTARIVWPMKIQTIEEIRPQLKTGSILAPGLNSTYVGQIDRGLVVTSSARAALTAMDGTNTCLDLSVSLGIPLAEISVLVNELNDAGLIDTQKSKISVHARFHSPNANRASHESENRNDGAVRQLQIKLAPELSSTTWLANVRDGGVEIMSQRRDWHVSVFGDSRIATLLYGILLSSGVSHTYLKGGDDQKRVSEEDMCAGFLHPSDIGLTFGSRTQELSRELSLFPPSKIVSSENPSRFMIAVGKPPADRVQEWMSDGVPHLFIDGAEGARISLGPIVIPGHTPCLRCVSMALEDQNPMWREISMRRLIAPVSEVPVAVAHQVAGVAALEILHFLDEGQSQLIGTTTQMSYHRPINIQQQTFPRHPACGCNW